MGDDARALIDRFYRPIALSRTLPWFRGFETPLLYQSADVFRKRGTREARKRGEFFYRHRFVSARLGKNPFTGPIPIEQNLKPILNHPFAITSLPDPKFGERIVLLYTGDALAPDSLISLPKYQRPKSIFYTHEIPLTETGKINRPACRHLAVQLQKEAYRDL